jgi:hypothetical protein
MVGLAHTEAMNPAVLAGVFMQSFFFFFAVLTDLSLL